MTFPLLRRGAANKSDTDVARRTSTGFASAVGSSSTSAIITTNTANTTNTTSNPPVNTRKSSVGSVFSAFVNTMRGSRTASGANFQQRASRTSTSGSANSARTSTGLSADSPTDSHMHGNLSNVSNCSTGEDAERQVDLLDEGLHQLHLTTSQILRIPEPAEASLQRVAQLNHSNQFVMPAGSSSASLPLATTPDSPLDSSENLVRHSHQTYSYNLATSPTMAELTGSSDVHAADAAEISAREQSASFSSHSTTPLEHPNPIDKQVEPAADADADDDVEDIRGHCDKNGYYSIRLTPFIDHSSSAPYMFFGPIIRKLRPGMKIPVGRYTEKCKSAATAPQGSSAPVVFKSKVVSRKHAQLSVDDEGRWFIKDVRSSSGTFLNHVRMSLANVESGAFQINDSDILQLGMDYRGGSEDIYRCVKVKIELNYSWRRRGAKFSKEAHERLKAITLTQKEEDLTPCVICLSPIKPCQAVFVSSCSHAWHYKCIRPLIVKTYPQFMCPNCKAICDIEADLDDEDN